MAADFDGMIEMRLTHPLWMEFVPLLGRRVHDYYRFSDRCGEQLAITSAVAKNPVSVWIAGTEFIYRRESLKLKRFLTIADERGEIISGQDGKPEMAILRYVKTMPVVLAMYWLIRLCDWDGHG